MTMAGLHETIAALSDNEHLKYALHIPWVKNGFRFATDGRICVRCPTTEADTELPERYKPYPNVNEVILRPEQCQSDGITIPDLPALIAPVICKSCNGTGGNDCPTCRQNVYCTECDNEGYESDGNYRYPVKLFEPDGYFGLRYMHILKSFGATCFPRIKEPQGLKSRTIRFVAGDCEGTLMGIEREWAEKKLSESC